MDDKQETNTTISAPLIESKSQKFFTNMVLLISIAIIIIIGGITTYQFYNLIDSNRWVRHTYDVISTIQNSLYQITYLETRQRGYLLFGDPEYPHIMQAAEAEVQNSVKALRHLASDNVSQQLKNNKLADLLTTRIQMLHKRVEENVKNNISSQIVKESFNKGQILSDEIRALANEIIAVELSLLKERDTEAVKNAALANNAFAIGQILSVVFLLIAFILFNRELKKRRQEEINRKNIENQLRSIISGVNDMVAAVDEDYRYIIFNRPYEDEIKKLFDKQITIGMTLEEALANKPTEKEKILESWRMSLSGKEYIKNLLVKVNGEEKIYEISSSLIRDENNNILGAVHINRNITEKMREQNILNTGLHELKDKNEKITILLEMSDIMLACNSLGELSEIIAKYCGKVLSFSSGIFYIMHPSKNFLEAGARWGHSNSTNEDFVQDQCWSLRLGHIHHAKFAENELICEHINVNNKPDIFYLCVPLRAKNDIYGLLYIEVSSSEGKENLTSNERLLVNAFAELAALALANVRLRENLSYQSIRDPLTTLHNRRYLEEFLLKQIYQSERTRMPIAVLMLDVDHFKMINDVNGHEAGDMVLKELAQIFIDDIRPGDLAARYGGEEFIIVLYDTDLTTAKERAEAIRKSVSTLHSKFGAQHIGGVTISIGIAVYPSDGRNSEDLIAAADKALYTAKNTGRNKVVTFSEMKENSKV